MSSPSAPVPSDYRNLLPTIFNTVDQSSLSAQSHLLIAVKVRLYGLILAALFGMATWKFGRSPTDWAGVLAAISFFVAVLVELYLLKERPDRTWYEGRAAAESIRTLCWRYSVGGEPFNHDLPGRQVDDLYLQQLSAVINLLKDLKIAPPSPAETQITAQMEQLRAAPLEERKRVYELHRVADQQVWYQRKADSNARDAFLWTMGMLAAEVVGVVAAILKAVGAIEGDVLGFAGAVVAAMVAWLQTKQHHALATAYSVTALELASVRTKIRWQQSEGDWAKFVSDAEEAFSREHTLWKASQGTRSI